MAKLNSKLSTEFASNQLHILYLLHCLSKCEEMSHTNFLSEGISEDYFETK